MIREKDLNDYLESWVGRKFPRFLGNRFFQGTIKTAIAGGTAGSIAAAAAAGTFVCTLSRTNESQADGNSYFCNIAGYTPLAGDVVQCAWIDANIGVVIGVISRAPTAGSKYSARAYRAAALNITSNTTIIKVQLDSETYDFSNSFDSVTNFNFIAPVAGSYHVDGNISAALALRAYIAIGVNGLEVLRGSDLPAGRGFHVSGDLYPIAVGDAIDLRFLITDNVAHAIDIGSSVTYLDVRFLG